MRLSGPDDETLIRVIGIPKERPVQESPTKRVTEINRILRSAMDADTGR
ncbi:MAG TPA: hypothetical protein VHB27_13480 [Rhodopila sp.]|nr:hypothetical protein [Rhodopila sp.]HVY16231.1 hypothetical protein [Rhodopila sp.]